MIAASAAYKAKLNPSKSYRSPYFAAVMADKPTAYYRLGEQIGSTSTAADSSGNGLHGTYNGTYTGKRGALTYDADLGITFDGATAYIAVADNGLLDPGDVLSGEAWIYPGAGTQVIFCKGADSYYFGYESATGLISLSKQDVALIVSSSITFATNTWHHVVFTKSGSTVRLYGNGVDVTGSVSNQTIVANGNAVRIGSNFGSQYFNGSLDEVALYSYELPAARVAAHYAAASAPMQELMSRGMCPIYQARILEPLIRRPIAYWAMEEASGTRYDAVGENHLTDQTSTTQAAGKVSNAAQFIRTDGDYLMRIDNEALSTGDIDFSFTAWVYLDSTPGGLMTIAGRWDSTAGDQGNEWILFWNNGTTRFVFSVYEPGNPTAIGSVAANNLGTPSTGTWYFVVVWHDSALDTVNIQVNNGTPNSSAVVGTMANTNASFRIGAYLDTTVQGFWDGRIDEAGFWKVVLTENERRLLYNNGTGLTYSAFPDRDAVDLCTSWPQSREPIGEHLLAPLSLERRADPENCRLPLSTFQFLIIDRNDRGTAIVTGGIVGDRVVLRSGFWDLTWADTALVLFTGIITEVRHSDGAYHVTAQSLLAAARDKTVFAGGSSRLTTAINDTDTTLALEQADDFDDAASNPQTSVRVVLIDSEIMAYRAKSGDQLLNVLRPGASGYFVPPAGGPSVSHAIGAVVAELPKLGALTSDNANYAIDDLHPMELLKSVFDSGGKLGISESEVTYNETSLDAAKTVLGATAQFRFVHSEGISAKTLIEEQLFLPSASYPIENAAGEIGIKLFQASSEASFVAALTDKDILSRPEWLRNAQRIITTVIVHYDYMPITGEYQSTYTYSDDTKVTALGRESILEIFSQGIRAVFVSGGQEWFGYTATFLPARVAAFVDRFGGVSPRLKVLMLWRNHLLELGDDIEASFTEVPDVNGGTRDIEHMPFEVTAVMLDFQRHQVEVELLGYPA